MQSNIFLYVLLLVGLILVAVFLGGRFISGNKTTTTTIHTSTTSTTISSGGNTTVSTTSQTTTSIKFSNCLSSFQTVNILGGDFSTGTYQYWNVSGPGFGSAPVNIKYANSNGFYYGNSTWSNYNGNFFATTYHGQNVQSGNLTSIPFQVQELYLNFKVISPESSFLYVQLLNGSKPVITTHYNTFVTGTANAIDTFANASIPLGTQLCKNLSIRVVAGITASPVRMPSFIAVGDFYLSRFPVATPGIVVSQNIT